MELGKMQPMPYTIGLIKPDTAADNQKLQSIFNQIQESGLQIYQHLTITLDKQDVINLFSKHIQREFFQDIQQYIMSGPCKILLLTQIDGDPISVWKDLIGPSEPSDAKSRKPQSLRAVYGTSWLKNEFYGSDDYMQANRQRDIFDLPIPVREPDFQFDKYKITLETLMRFLYPPHLQHSNVCGRLDIFAVYGPIVNYHSVDLGCFCLACSRIGKERIRNTIGMTTVFKKGKLSEPNKRLLQQQDILEIWNELCDNCRYHCENYSHLPSGRASQHLMRDLEINQLIKEMNQTQLEEMLKGIKGNAAKTIMMSVDLTQPKEICYNQYHVRELLQEVQTDYFNRMNFYDIQKKVLEDRKTRINYWMSKITGKPIESLPSFTQEKRKLPISLTNLQKPLNQKATAWEASIVDQPKLSANAQKVALLKRMHREACLIANPKSLNSRDTANNVRLLRNYATGRHGGWDNYISCKHPESSTAIHRRRHPK